jgi:hypothetical protein
MNVMTPEMESAYISLVLSRHFVKQEEVYTAFETSTIVTYIRKRSERKFLSFNYCRLCTQFLYAHLLLGTSEFET